MFGSHYFFQLCIVFCLILLHLFRVGLGFVVVSVRFALFALVCFALLATVFPFGFALFALVCFAFFALVCLSLFALVCLSLFAFGAVFSVYWVAVGALVGGAFVALASFFAFVALHGCRLALLALMCFAFLALMCGCSSVVMVAWCAWRQLGGVFLIERKQLGGLLGVEIVLRHHVVGFLLCQVGGCAFVFLAVVAVLCLGHRGTAQCDDH